MTEPRTVSFKISPFVAYMASGSDISNPDTDSGYDHGLARELARIGTKGGTLHLTADGLRDLAEWCYDLSIAVAQEPNPSGARSLLIHQERALDQAKLLD